MCSCKKFAAMLAVLGALVCIGGWQMINSSQELNSSEPVEQRTCNDVCGSQFWIQLYGLCCNSPGQGYCKSKQICRQENDSLYEKIKTYLEIGFFINMGVFGLLLLYVVCKWSQMMRRRARSNAYNHRLINIEQPFVVIPPNQYQPLNANPSLRLPDSFLFRDSTKMCAVCIEDFDSEKAIQLDCGHVYHSKCIRSWVNQKDTCPLCRVKV